MAFGALIRIAFFAGLTVTTAFSADQGELCFDLTKPNLRLLKPAPSQFSEVGAELKEFGIDKRTGFAWARADGLVSKPIDVILKKFMDPLLTRDRDTTRVKVTELETPGALLKQQIKVTVKPIFFLTLEWEEEWLFTLKEGSATQPRSVVISYQKTSGTSHIQHFCGTILIQRLKPDLSGIYLTEEIKADRRTPENVSEGLLGTLRTLREP